MFIARDPLGAVRLAAKGMQPSRRAPFDCSTGLDHVQELRPEKVEVLSHRLESHDKDLAERTLSARQQRTSKNMSALISASGASDTSTLRCLSGGRWPKRLCGLCSRGSARSRQNWS